MAISVFEKSSAADPARRTFRIDLIVRNARRHVYQLKPGLQGLPVINDYLPVIREFQGEGGPLFVHSESLFTEGDKHYVFRIPGVSFNAGAKKSAVGKHIPEKRGDGPGAAGTLSRRLLAVFLCYARCGEVVSRKDRARNASDGSLIPINAAAARTCRISGGTSSRLTGIINCVVK